jgi:ABC-type Na+ efflux pump permease subunit
MYPRYLQMFTGGFVAIGVFFIQMLPGIGGMTNTIRWVLRLNPAFSICYAMTNIAIGDMVGQTGGPWERSYEDLISMLVLGIVYSVAIWAIETRLFSAQEKQMIDSDDERVED